MKNIIQIIGLITFLLSGFSGYTQRTSEISIGYGLNSYPNNSLYMNNEPGGSIGIYIPFMIKSSFTIGAEINGSYFTSKKIPVLSSSGFNIADSKESTLSLDKDSRTNQNSLSWGVGPRFSFLVGKKVSLQASLVPGVVHTKKEPLSFNQYTVYSYGDTVMGEDKIDMTKTIYSQDKIAKASFALTSKVRVSYPLGRVVSLWISTQYTSYSFSSSGKEISPESGSTELFDYWEFMEMGSQQFTKKNKVNLIGGQVGLAFLLGKNKKPGKPAALNAIGFNSSRSNRPTDFRNPPDNDSDSTTNPSGRTRAIGFNSSRSNKPMEDMIVTNRPVSNSDSSENPAKVSEAIGFNSSRSNRPTDYRNPPDNDSDSTTNPSGRTRAIGFNSSRSNRPMELRNADKSVWNKWLTGEWRSTKTNKKKKSAPRQISSLTIYPDEFFIIKKGNQTLRGKYSIEINEEKAEMYLNPPKEAGDFYKLIITPENNDNINIEWLKQSKNSPNFISNGNTNPLERFVDQSAKKTR